MKSYYPLFADLEGRQCVVVGGGLIAERKVGVLVRCGAQVTVISPTATRRLKTWARAGRIRYVQRRFRPQDVRGAWLAVAATNDQSINEAVFRNATRRRIFTNVVDQKPLCSFIVPAIARRGPLTIAVSTGGASPAIAKRVRSEMSRWLSEAYVPMLRLLASLRGPAKRRLPAYNDRKRYFNGLVAGKVFRLVRSGEVPRARRLALALLEQQASNGGRE